MSDYRRFADEAVVAFYHGNHRLSASKYLQSFQASSDKWEPTRWQIFHGYTSILQEEYFEASNSDLKALKEIAGDSKELQLYRCEATFTFGLLSWLRNDRAEAVNTYLNTLRLADKTKKQEGQNKVLATITTPDGNRVAGIGMKPMGELIAGIREQASHNLQQMQTPLYMYNMMSDDPPQTQPEVGQNRQVRSDGTPLPPAKRFTKVVVGPQQTELTEEMTKHLLREGGDRCDCCGKTRQGLGTNFRSCSQCGKAWYCNRECQVKQWKAGHKQYCRKPGQIAVGDFVRLQGLESKPEMNDLLVEVIGPDSITEGRWEVRIPGGTKSVSIATGKMEQLRPLK